MTAREKLRRAAKVVESAGRYPYGIWDEAKCDELAAALRALAARMDVEMRACLAMEQETRDTNDVSGWGCAAAIAQTLTRLDADLAPPVPPPPPCETCKLPLHEGHCVREECNEPPERCRCGHIVDEHGRDGKCRWKLQCLCQGYAGAPRNPVKP